MSIQELAVVVSRITALGALRQTLVGSTYALGAGKDIDILAEVPNQEGFAGLLTQEGWTREGLEGYPVGDFISCRKGEVNVLLVADRNYYDRFALAAEVCKVLHLQSRDDRVKVHKVVRDRKSAEAVELGL